MSNTLWEEWQRVVLHITCITAIISDYGNKWYEHTERMEWNHIPRSVFKYCLWGESNI